MLGNRRHVSVVLALDGASTVSLDPVYVVYRDLSQIALRREHARNGSVDVEFISDSQTFVLAEAGVMYWSEMHESNWLSGRLDLARKPVGRLLSRLTDREIVDLSRQAREVREYALLEAGLAEAIRRGDSARLAFRESGAAISNEALVRIPDLISESWICNVPCAVTGRIEITPYESEYMASLVLTNNSRRSICVTSPTGTVRARFELWSGDDAGGGSLVYTNVRMHDAEDRNRMSVWVEEMCVNPGCDFTLGLGRVPLALAPGRYRASWWVHDRVDLRDSVVLEDCLVLMGEHSVIVN